MILFQKEEIFETLAYFIHNEEDDLSILKLEKGVFFL